MADYPASVKTFSTKVADDTIEASHPNDIQDEVTAVEDGLLNGLAHHLLPDADDTYDLGSSSLQWRNVYCDELTLNGVTVSSLASPFLTNGRLTLTTAVPVTTADVTAATTLYFALYGGNKISLYSGTAWVERTFAQLSIAVPATTDTVYDVFVYDNAGTATLELTAWTNDTTRATALTLQDGVLSKTGALTRKYVGTFRTTGVSGQTEDSLAKRYVWNYYNRVPRPLRVNEATNSWNYHVATFQQANASAANQVDVVVGWAEVPIDLRLIAHVSNSTGGVFGRVAIGEDSATDAASGSLIGATVLASAFAAQIHAALIKYPAVGRHYYTWLEQSDAVATTTWYGDNNTPTTIQSGMHGSIDG
jgi:hypothetical protein